MDIKLSLFTVFVIFLFSSSYFIERTNGLEDTSIIQNPTITDTSISGTSPNPETSAKPVAPLTPETSAKPVAPFNPETSTNPAGDYVLNTDKVVGFPVKSSDVVHINGFIFYLLLLVDIFSGFYTAYNTIRLFKYFFITYLVTFVFSWIALVKSHDHDLDKNAYLAALKNFTGLHSILRITRPFVLLICSGHLFLHGFMILFDGIFDIFKYLSLFEKNKSYIYFLIGVLFSCSFSYYSVDYSVYGTFILFIVNFLRRLLRPTNGNPTKPVPTKK